MPASHFSQKRKTNFIVLFGHREPCPMSHALSLLQFKTFPVRLLQQRHQISASRKRCSLLHLSSHLVISHSVPRIPHRQAGLAETFLALVSLPQTRSFCISRNENMSLQPPIPDDFPFHSVIPETKRAIFRPNTWPGALQTQNPSKRICPNPEVFSDSRTRYRNEAKTR